MYHLLPQEIDVLRDGPALLQDGVHHLHGVLLTEAAGLVELQGTAGGKAVSHASAKFFRFHRRIIFLRQGGRRNRVALSDLDDLEVPFEEEKQRLLT